MVFPSHRFPWPDAKAPLLDLPSGPSKETAESESDTLGFRIGGSTAPLLQLRPRLLHWVDSFTLGADGECGSVERLPSDLCLSLFGISDMAALGVTGQPIKAVWISGR
jgi:hypothetical protein